MPLEIKSVRDYGLGSVLSYVQGLRVVYQAGVYMDEAYNANQCYVIAYVAKAFICRCWYSHRRKA